MSVPFLAGAQLNFYTRIQFRIFCLGNGDSHGGLGLPISVNLIKTPLSHNQLVLDNFLLRLSPWSF